MRFNDLKLCMFLFCFSSTAFAGISRDWYKVAYEMPTSMNYLYNKSENLAWGETYSQCAILDEFEVSGDLTLLDEMVKRVDAMIGTMWDVPPADVLCNRTVYQDGYLGWGSTYYDDHKYYQEYMVHDGMIIYPVTRLIRYIYGDPSLYSAYGDKARSYLQTLETHIIGKWSVNWEGKPNQSGLELEHWGGFKYLPHNQYLVFGAALLVLAEIAESPHYTAVDPAYPRFYTDKATEMGSFFKSKLYHYPAKDAYIWSYWNSGVEDFSHGYMDILYTLEAYRRGVVFDLTDMRRFTNTFLKLIWDGNLDSPFISGAIDGSSSDNQGYYSWVWTSLCEFDFLVWEVVNSYHEKNYSKRRKEGVARLALDVQRFDVYPPAAPSVVLLTKNPDGTYKILWEEPTVDEDLTRITGLAGYHLYRATSSAGPFTKISDAPIQTYFYNNVDPQQFYVVTAVDYHRPANESRFSGMVTDVSGTGDDRITAQPCIHLFQNFPNPFNSNTMIRYSVDDIHGTHVRISVFELNGRLVKTLVDEYVTAGEKSILWDGSNDRSEPVASGLYYYSVETESFKQLKKMTVLR